MPLVVPDDPLRGDPAVRLESQLEARARAGSYRELERALSKLRAVDPRRFRWVVGAFAAGAEPYEGAWDRQPARLAEEMLLRWMPSRIRVPADVRYAWEHRHVHGKQAERARENSRRRVHRRLSLRDRQIVDLYARGAGLSTDVLAERFGISVRQVRRIVRP